MILEEIKHAAMTLPETEREHLAMDLLESLSAESPLEYVSIEEIDRRTAELEADPTTGITLEELLASFRRNP